MCFVRIIHYFFKFFVGYSLFIVVIHYSTGILTTLFIIPAFSDPIIHYSFFIYTRYSLFIIHYSGLKRIISPLRDFLLFRLLMSCFKWMHISKKRFSRFFLCSGMKLEFLFSTGINNSNLYSFWTETIYLFAGLFGFEMRGNNKFFHSVCLIVFRCALTMTRKFCPYVRNM